MRRFIECHLLVETDCSRKTVPSPLPAIESQPSECDRLAGVFQSFLRMQLLSPSRVGGFITHLPSFVRVFYRLMIDPRVSTIAKLVPPLGLLLLFTPPA